VPALPLLSLDLASNIGWAVQADEAGALQYGSHQLPKTGTDVGLYVFAYYTWLQQMVDRHGIRLITHEASLFMGRPGKDGRPTSSLMTQQKLVGLTTTTKLYGRIAGIRCLEGQPGEIKRFWTGKGNAKKPDMVRRCREWGYDPKDHDQADAIALAEFAIASLWPDLGRQRMEQLYWKAKA
jgi:Holliday junction resolvasome RuvABC endonuclease subunit